LFYDILSTNFLFLCLEYQAFAPVVVRLAKGDDGGDELDKTGHWETMGLGLFGLYVRDVMDFGAFGFHDNFGGKWGM